MMALTIQQVAGTYAVARMAADAPVPAWLSGAGFAAYVRAQDEVTLVCLQDRVPMDVPAERNWACLRTVGPFDFQASGVVQALIAPLSSNGIGVFVVCTFDGEHLLVARTDLDRALGLLKTAGHRVPS